MKKYSEINPENLECKDCDKSKCNACFILEDFCIECKNKEKLLFEGDCL